jgi:uncharacterized membrane protein
MTWFPMHSWHPVMVHLPLVGLVVAVAFDLVAARNRSARWRDAATVLWWVGLLGAAAAITTGLLAYNRVEHSDPAHEEMVLHRNLALATIAVLLITALWRWKRPYSPGAALLGLIGAMVLGGVGYLGGDLVYRHGLGISTEALEEIAHERGGHAHGHAAESAQPDTMEAQHHH